MVLTDRQRADLHAGIYEYLRHQKGDAFQKAAEAFALADPMAATANSGSNGTATIITPLLEKKWTAIPRLQKKVLELERQAAHNAHIHAHRTNLGMAGSSSAAGGGAGEGRRMLPRLPSAHTLKGHSMVVTCVAVHPVYTMVVSGSEDGTIKMWDHESGDYIRTLKGHTNTVNDVCFTPTGSHLASCSTDLSIKLWDFGSQYNCLRTLRGHDHTISAIRFLPLSTTENLNASSSTTTTGLTTVAAHAKHLISASRDQTVKMWDIETGFCDATLMDHTDWVRCLATQETSSGEPRWASAGNDQVIRVYEQEGYKSSPVATLRGHEHVIEALSFLSEPTGSNKFQRSNHTSKASTSNTSIRDFLASGSRDRTVRLWSLLDQSCLAVFSSHENWVRAVIIHPSGQYIISAADDKSIRVFDIKAQRCLRSLDQAHEHFVTSIDIHPTLPILVSGSVDQTVRCWKLD